MTSSPDLGIPQLAQAQANPDVTFNEAFVMVQALLNGVLDKDLTAPPGSHAEGDAYLINTAAPTGAWAGRAFKIAIYWGGSWRFIPGNNDAGTPIAMGARQEGLTVWVRDENKRYVWQNSVASPANYDWVEFAGGTPAANSITDGMLRQSAALSVIGRSANSTGDVADITAASNDQLFARVSNSLAFTSLTNAMVPANTLGLDKLANASAQYNIVARTSANAGAWEQKASSSDVFAILGAANNAAIRTLLSLGAAALLGVATDAEARAQSSSVVLLTPANLNGRQTFQANKNGTDQTGIASNTDTKVTFTTEKWDIGSAYDNTNSRVAPTNKMRLSANIYASGGLTPGSATTIRIYRNGAAYMIGPQILAGSSGDALMNVTMLVDGNTSDTYDIYFRGVTTTSITISGLVITTYFEGEQT